MDFKAGAGAGRGVSSFSQDVVSIKMAPIANTVIRRKEKKIDFMFNDFWFLLNNLTSLFSKSSITDEDFRHVFEET
jgi:hypothetical protein